MGVGIQGTRLRIWGIGVEKGGIIVGMWGMQGIRLEMLGIEMEIQGIRLEVRRYWGKNETHKA